jgi:endonuclease/exonuclease/phosphatase family metal-dependent hydrolase
MPTLRISPNWRAITSQPEHRRHVDYVFTGSAHAHPDGHCHIFAARLVFDQPAEGLRLSDHYGVVVDLEIGIDG